MKTWHVEGNSLAVQWLGLCVFTAKGTGSIPGGVIKIPQAAQCGQKLKKKNFKYKKNYWKILVLYYKFSMEKKFITKKI